MSRRSRRYDERNHSKHRLHFRFESMLCVIFLMPLFIGYYNLTFSIGWILFFIGLGGWFFSLLLDINELASDGFLLISDGFMAIGVILADMENPPIAAGFLPSWILLLLSVFLIGLMKIDRQAAVHVGAITSWSSIAVGFFLSEISASIGGIGIGIVLTILLRMIITSHDWNFRVCIGFVGMIFVIVSGWFVSIGSANQNLVLLVYLAAILGPIVCTWGIINVPHLPKPKIVESERTSTKKKVEHQTKEDVKVIEEDTGSLQKPSVFLSHSHDDKEFVRRLAQDLENAGVKTWVDEAEILVGESLIKKISLAISEVDFVAAVLSTSSVKSSWVQTELELAITDEINNKQVRVLPLLLEKCELPDYLKNKLYLDFVDDYDNQVDTLVDHIKKHYEKRKSVDDTL